MTTNQNHPSRARLLIVDRSADSIEVLRTVFERRGISILEADQVDEGLESMRQNSPDVVVLDLETVPESQAWIQSAFEAESRQSDAALVILGKASQPTDLPADHVVAKPYHYGPLVRTIEQLLDRPATRRRTAA